MKKILNDANNVEDEMIRGLVESAPKMLRKNPAVIGSCN